MTTPLDAAHAAMLADPSDDAARLRFYERVLDSALSLVLAAEGGDDRVEPLLLEIADATYVAVFDLPERLAAFLDAPRPMAQLAGRSLVRMLAGQGLGMALNPAVAPSSQLIPPEAVTWLAGMLEGGTEGHSARPRAVFPPTGAPEALIGALGSKLAAMAGSFDAAYLVTAEFTDGTRGLILALAGVLPPAQAGMTEAAMEALRFSGIEAGTLDVLYLKPDTPALIRIARVGLRFDLPRPSRSAAPTSPGMDSDRPPILRR